MAKLPQILDQFGRPVQRAELKREISAPTFGGVRSPLGGYPSQGLDPVRLANILRAADLGDPVRYLELAEEIEEKDLHYLGVLGTRKRSISQIEITVEPGGDTQFDLDAAKAVEDWLKRDELRDEVFDILDAVGKGYSHTEIIWDTSMGDWVPERLEWRDPRWFRFDRVDHRTPVRLNDQGQEEPYPGFKYIFANMKAKSGLPIRSGLARAAVWAFMFKKFTERDWAIFTQTYGQPLRVGKYGTGASERDRDTLFAAVANIAGDCAAIIPREMEIEFVESANVGSSTDHYERRADWYDKQISKAVLGQTSTTDAQVGGLGSGKEHREVQEDIEKADCSQLQAILNRWLIRPWHALQYGENAPPAPRLKIGRPEEEDLKAFTDAVGPLIDRGLEVDAAQVYSRFGLSKPAAGAQILRPMGGSAPPAGVVIDPTMQASLTKRFLASIKRPLGSTAGTVALNAEEHSAALSGPLGDAADRLANEASAPMLAMLEQIEAMLETSTSLAEFRERLLAGFPDLDDAALRDVIAAALTAAHAGGRAALEEDSG